MHKLSNHRPRVKSSRSLPTPTKSPGRFLDVLRIRPMSHPVQDHRGHSGLSRLRQSLHPYSLFDIRLDSDFVIFYGSDDESPSQFLRGVLVLCLTSPLEIENIHLRLVGTIRHLWTEPGASGEKVNILDHRWSPFVGEPGQSMILEPGNYEWPFEYMLPGDTVESVEGIPEASVTYGLKATIERGKLMRNVHARRPLRIIRTLSPTALEFMHAMAVESTWRDKVDYSISIPSKAAVFGGSVSLDMRFSPLLKGLRLGHIMATLVEIHEYYVQTPTFHHIKEHKTERKVSSWVFEEPKEQYWQETIEDIGQEGWAFTKQLDLPKKLRHCIQDFNHHSMKVSHKIRVLVSLLNPDGHISELTVALPVYIYISPNAPLDGSGSLVSQIRNTSSNDMEASAVPPGYGAHVLDQLYTDMDDFHGQHRPSSSGEHTESEETDTPRTSLSHDRYMSSVNGSRSRQHSRGRSPQHGHDDQDSEEFYDLNRVPTYRTALRTPLRSHSPYDNILLPDYQAVSEMARSSPESG